VLVWSFARARFKARFGTLAGAHAEAIAPFRRAVELDPRKPGYHYNLGAALQFVGDFAGAEQAYRAALRLDPAQARLWSALLAAVPMGLAVLVAMQVPHLEWVVVSGLAGLGYWRRKQLVAVQN